MSLLFGTKEKKFELRNRNKRNKKNPSIIRAARAGQVIGNRGREREREWKTSSHASQPPIPHMKLVEMWMTYLSKQKKTKNEAKCVVASSEVNKWKVIFIRSKWRICQWWLHPSSWMTNATFPVFFVVSEPVLLYTSNSTSDENRFLFMVGGGVNS